MSAIDTTKYRKQLEDEKARLAHAVGFLDADNPGTMADELGELAEGGVDNHLGDMATEMLDRELEDGLEDGAKGQLAEIDAALQRIEDGTYGICEACGKPIAPERLAAIPWARLCIDDQRRLAG